ncbi:MAG TPA: TetR/AcrR family transcriptional regulator, partial [Thermodesulfobacteriota bacterium]|nr:TetR/AcrR family transcriptional regulator [Thermodesulfobacteriota bacterium]
MAKNEIQTPSRRPLTPKGAATRMALLEAAQEVFKDQGYYSTSVSEITRRAGVSMGTYYQYFKNKEELFLELNHFIIGRFWERAKALPRNPNDPGKNLSQVVQLLFDHISEYLYFHRLLGEFELIDSITIPYYNSIAGFLKNFFRREARLGSIQPFNPEMMAYGCIGMVYFQVLDWGPKAPAYPPAQILSLTLDLLLHGISGP